MTVQLIENMRRGGQSQPQGRMIMAAADEIDRLRAGLRSIADNTCCDGCQEAAKVAAYTLKEPRA